MYALMEEMPRQGSPPPQAEGDCTPLADEGRPTDCRQAVEGGEFDEDTGLSVVRELAVALGLVEIDDAGLWEPA